MGIRVGIYGHDMGFIYRWVILKGLEILGEFVFSEGGSVCA